jgi:hypothetical protein
MGRLEFLAEALGQICLFSVENLFGKLLFQPFLPQAILVLSDIIQGHCGKIKMPLIFLYLEPIFMPEHIMMTGQLNRLQLLGFQLGQIRQQNMRSGEA